MEESTDTEYPINGVLDLHMFRPREVAAVVEEYLFACGKKGILDVRIIHGKGIGTLRDQVRKQLAGHPGVASSSSGDGGSGGWGATIVRLQPFPWRKD